MMNSTVETSAVPSDDRDSDISHKESREKLNEAALTTDEFAFKPKLEMLDRKEEQVMLTFPHDDDDDDDFPTQPNQDSSYVTFQNPANNPSTLTQYVYPSNHGTQSMNETVRGNLLRKFYATRAGSFEHAVEDIKQYLKPTIDGKFLSAWLLTELDHWDHEKERIVILTDTLLILIKYNFVALRIDDCRRIQLHRIDRIQGGRFQYPDKTLMMPRVFQTGIRFSWNKNEVLTKWQRFSPFFNSPSYVTFTQHKAAQLLTPIPQHMIYEDFKAAVIDAVQKAGAVFETVLEPIYIEVYVGAMSIIHNSSDLGYSKDRGAASF